MVSHLLSIDAYRLIAHRTGTYLGSSAPEFKYDENGKPLSASITVRRLVSGEVGEFNGTVFQRVNKNRDQRLDKPLTMLEKCAEAKALRKAFPEDLSGLYIRDEMPSGDQAPIAIKEDTPELEEAKFDRNDFGMVKWLNKYLAKRRSQRIAGWRLPTILMAPRRANSYPDLRR